jgi:DNA-binding response OmpR family regulator
MPRILVIEDEPDMQFILTDNLRAEGYQVEAVARGREGIAQALSGNFELILLDLMLPDINGIEVCKAIRAQDRDTPIVVLTAKGEEIDKVVGLEVGADDYVTKPFGMREFLARVKAALRRSGRLQGQSLKEARIGDARIDFTTRELSRGKEKGKLTRYETDLLRFLTENRGQVVSRKRILEEVWGSPEMEGSRIVDNYVARLRAKIEKLPDSPKHILTLHGSGYKLV